MVVQVIKSHLTGEIIYTTDVMACAFKLSLTYPVEKVIIECPITF